MHSNRKSISVFDKIRWAFEKSTITYNKVNNKHGNNIFTLKSIHWLDTQSALSQKTSDFAHGYDL